MCVKHKLFLISPVIHKTFLIKNFNISPMKYIISYFLRQRRMYESEDKIPTGNETFLIAYGVNYDKC